MLEKTLEKDADVEELIITQAIERIDQYILMIQPTELAYIAFDGVAPFAKMEQQRSRRYKSAFLSSNVEPKSPVWNTTNITPGTQFMDSLTKRVRAYYADPINIKKHITERIIFSSSDEYGEGEHKMFSHIRSTQFDKEDTVAVYGLDSDLIMLSIFHCQMFQNLYIFREAPEFVRSQIQLPIDPMEHNPNNKHSCYFMDIKTLSTAILSEMGSNSSARVYDYIFMCFFLGNDFLPQFPSLNIRTNGIDILMNVYKNYIGKFPERAFISSTMSIEWKWVLLFVKELAKLEHGNFIAQQDLRNKFKKRVWKVASEEDRENTFLNVPVIYNFKELYICPTEKGWEKRYYKSLLCDSDPKTISLNYLEGLEWVFRYYTQECPDWNWKYNYHYPPLLKDLHNVDIVSPFFANNKNDLSRRLTAAQQMEYIIPPLIRPENMEYEWSYMRYIWESEVVM